MPEILAPLTKAQGLSRIQHPKSWLFTLILNCLSLCGPCLGSFWRSLREEELAKRGICRGFGRKAGRLYHLEATMVVGVT
jgi:hypothetical protein